MTTITKDQRAALAAKRPLDRRVGRQLTPHQKIMRAAKRETGLRLTQAEVWALSCDSAIETRGILDDVGHDENDDLPHAALTASVELRGGPAVSSPERPA